MKNIGKALFYCIGDIIILFLPIMMVSIFNPLLPRKIADDFCAEMGLILGIIAIAMIYKNQGVSLIKDCKFKKVKLNVLFKIILVTICLMFFSDLYQKITIDILHINMPAYQEMKKGYSDLLTSWYGIISAIIIAPVIEEIIFRGIMLRQCLRFVSPLSAIVIQALLFGVAHMNMIQSINCIIFGILIGYIAYYTKSIIPGIIMHSISNLLACISYLSTNNIYKLSNVPIIGILGLVLAIFLVHTLKENNKVKALT